MPKELEDRLKKQAWRKFGTSKSERAKKYIYGTMRDTGWRPAREERRNPK